MNISILGFKVNVELLILIGVIFLILVGHTVGGCCNCGKMWEGFEGKDGEEKDQKEEENEVEEPIDEEPVNEKKQKNTVVPAGDLIAQKAKHGSSKQMIKSGKEAFVSKSSDTPATFASTMSQSIDTSSWKLPSLTNIKKNAERKQEPFSQPDENMAFLAKTEFKPECCPNTYSNSSGCACMSSKDVNFLSKRGGNNVPYSVY